MFIGILFEFDVEQQLAWVGQSDVIFSTGDLARHREEVQLFTVIIGVRGGKE
jgi:hypothetical protein